MGPLPLFLLPQIMTHFLFLMFNIIYKIYFYTIGTFLIIASQVSAKIEEWTLAYTGFDYVSDSSYSSPHAIFLDYKIGTGRSSFDVNVLTKGCIKPVTDTTVRISSSTSEAVDEFQDSEVLLSLDKPKLVGSPIWDDRRPVELCVRVDLLSKSNGVIRRDEPETSVI